MIKKLILASVILAITTTAGYSKPRKHHHRQVQVQQQYNHADGFASFTGVSFTSVPQQQATTTRQATRRTTRHSRVAHQPQVNQQTAVLQGTETTTSQAGVIGGRPAGCPHRFCGCAAAIKIFGTIRKELNLASNWIRTFERTSPAPNMAAARSGHVFVLLSHVNGNVWRVYDGNSGGGKTRIHERSIAGYVIVDPQRPRHASL